MELPNTQNVIGKASLVRSKNLGEGNEEHIWQAKLYMSSLVDNQTSAPTCSPDSDLLHLHSCLSASNNTLRSAYSSIDCSVSHCFVDPPHPNCLGLNYHLYKHM